MRSSFVSAAILAFASAVYAQTPNFDAITKPTQDENVQAGQQFDIVWDPSLSYTGTVSIALLQGNSPSTLRPVPGPNVASGILNSAGKYTWTVPTSLTSYPTYGFTITLDSNTSIFQYSNPFHITGLSGGASVMSGSKSPMSLWTGNGYLSSSALPPHSSTTSCGAPVMSGSTSTGNGHPSGSLSLSNIPPSQTNIPTSQPTPPNGHSTAGSGTTGTGTSGPSPVNAAVAQVAPVSLAMIGGLVLAFAL